MPRTSARTPAATILEFFRTASLDTAQFVIELGQNLLKERRAVTAAVPAQTLAPSAIRLPGPTAASAKPAAKGKVAAKAVQAKKATSAPRAAAATAADKPARRKPGPKPGSHRKKPGQVAVPHITEPDELHQPLDLREPIPGEPVWEDVDDYVPPPAPGELPDYTQQP